MSSMESISRKRLFFCTLFGVAIVALIAFMQPSGKEDVDESPAINPLTKALSRVPDDIPFRQFNAEHWQSSLGVPVYFIRTPELDMLDVQLSINAGSARDGEHPGLAALTASLLDNGTIRKTADEVARSLEQLGSQYYSFSDRDRTVLHIRTLSDKEHLSSSINLLTEIVSQPAFRPDDFNRLKSQQRQTVQSLSKDPSFQSWLKLARFLYPNHPYASPDLGTEESLNNLSIKDVQHFYQTYYGVRNLSIIMTGNITREQAEQISEQMSLSLPIGTTATALSTPEPRTTSTTRHIPLETEQVQINLGFQGISRSSPDYPALYVANQILGGNGLTSILMEQLREQQGLVYGAYSRLVAEQYGGSFIVSTETRAEKASHTIEEVKRLLNSFVSNGPTEQQLLDAKKMINGSFPLYSASNASLVYQFSDIALYKLPLDEHERFLAAINQLTVEDIKNAMAKIVIPKQMVMITTGPTPENEKH